MSKLNALRWFIYGFWMGVCALWLCLVFIFKDNSVAQEQLNPLLWGFVVSVIPVTLVITFLTSKVKKNRYQEIQGNTSELPASQPA